MLSIENRGRTAAICLWLVICASAISFVTEFSLQDYIIETYSTPGYDEGEFTNNDLLLILVSLGWVIAFLLSGITFLMWFYRARCNLERAKLTGFKYTSKWSILGFFVPILNILRPFQIMQEVWSGSKFLTKSTNVASWQKVHPGTVVKLWWGMTLFSASIDRVASYLWEHSETVAALQSTVYVSMIADVVNIIAAYITIKLIKEITELQEQARMKTPEISIPASIGV